eukprot:g3548.t1
MKSQDGEVVKKTIRSVKVKMKSQDGEVVKKTIRSVKPAKQGSLDNANPPAGAPNAVPQLVSRSRSETEEGKATSSAESATAFSSAGGPAVGEQSVVQSADSSTAASVGVPGEATTGANARSSADDSRMPSKKVQEQSLSPETSSNTTSQFSAEIHDCESASGGHHGSNLKQQHFGLHHGGAKYDLLANAGSLSEYLANQAASKKKMQAHGLKVKQDAVFTKREGASATSDQKNADAGTAAAGEAEPSSCATVAGSPTDTQKDESSEGVLTPGGSTGKDGPTDAAAFVPEPRTSKHGAVPEDAQPPASGSAASKPLRGSPDGGERRPDPQVIDPFSDREAMKKEFQAALAKMKGANVRARHAHEAVPRRHEDAEDAAVHRKLKSLMNKLTEKNFDAIYEQIVALLKKQRHVEVLVQEVFEKAVSQHLFIDLYTSLTKKLADSLEHHAELFSLHKSGKKQTFRVILLAQVQDTFEQSLTDSKDFEMRNGINDTDEECEAATKRKTRITGNVKFIGNLLRENLLASKIFVHVARALSEDESNDLNLEMLCMLCETTGTAWMSGPVQQWAHKELLPHVQTLSKDKKIKPRVRHMIQDLVDRLLFAPLVNAMNKYRKDTIAGDFL